MTNVRVGIFVKYTLKSSLAAWTSLSHGPCYAGEKVCAVCVLEREVREVAESGADQRARHYVAQEVHAEQNARHRDAEGAEEQTDRERRVKQSQRYGNREGGHGVAGRKGEPVGGQQRGPAVRFDLAWPAAARQALQQNEQQDAQDGRESRGAEGLESWFAAEKQDRQAHGVPEPSIADEGGAPDVDAHPAWRLPVIGTA